MHRLAVFVEGLTEALFVQSLIEEIAGYENIIIEKKSVKGGVNSPLTISSFEAVRPVTKERYYVLIMNCGGDRQVASRIKEQQSLLTNAGYSKIIGLRDVRPTFTLNDVPRLLNGLNSQIDHSLVPVEFILSLMEIEAWFLAEHTHLQKIDPKITLELVTRALGFDPSNGDLSDRTNPTQDITAAYALGGKQYYKGSQTVDCLDYDEIYLNLINRIPNLKILTENIDQFLALHS